MVRWLRRLQCGEEGGKEKFIVQLRQLIISQFTIPSTSRNSSSIKYSQVLRKSVARCCPHSESPLRSRRRAGSSGSGSSMSVINYSCFDFENIQISSKSVKSWKLCVGLTRAPERLPVYVGGGADGVPERATDDVPAGREESAGGGGGEGADGFSEVSESLLISTI